MKNFFNAIGVANMEKVHSSMIAWILDDENDPVHSGWSIGKGNFTTFPIKERSEIICKMFKQNLRCFNSICTHVEWNDIDVMIETTGAGGNEIWIIENKLKTPEHKSKVDAAEMARWGTGNQIWQTQKYEYVIKDYISSLGYTISQTHFLLLSLGGDKAKSPSKLWHELKYEDLHTILNSCSVTHPSAAMIREYINSVGEVVTELRDFIKTPINYPNVFTKMKKSVKETLLISGKGITPNERYILENGLETIFQKQFLVEMLKRAGLGSYSIVIDDDNGIAEFDCTFHTVKDSRGNDMWLQVQFQGGTFKAVLIHENYRNNQPSDYVEIYGSKSGNTWSGKWYKKFIIAEASYTKYGWKKRLAQRLGSIPYPKPRIALDKKMSIKDWYDYNDTNIVDMFIALFNETKSIVDYISNLP